MAIFDPAGAKNFSQVTKGTAVNGAFVNTLRVIIIALILASFAELILIADVDGMALVNRFCNLFVGAGLLFLFILSFLKDLYTPKPHFDSNNLAEALSSEMVKVVLASQQMAQENGFAAVEPILFLGAYEKNPDGKYMLMRAGFGLEVDLSGLIKAALAQIPRQESPKLVEFSDDFVASIEAARANAAAASRAEITSGDILIGLIEKSDVFKKLMFEIHLDEVDLKRVVEWHELLKNYSDRGARPVWEREWTGGIGRDWSFGFTPTLSQFAKNLSDEVEFSGGVHVYGRAREVDEIERILAKTGKNNALLIGEHGIGKKTIVKGFATKILHGQVLPTLKYQNIFLVDTGALLSGSNEGGEIVGRLKKIFNEAIRAGNIILFFDNFHALVSKEKGVGQVNIAEVILPYLESGIRVIGATTLADYHKNIEASPGVVAAFENIQVSEPNAAETTQILEEMIPVVEYRDGIFWPYQSVREAVRVSERFIHNKPFPDKAIGIVDEASVQVARSNKKIVSAADIDAMVSKQLEVPVAQAEGSEAQKLLHLEEFLHKRVIGQDEAIAAVANAMRRARSGLQPKNRPIGTFLFLGPTGVGKTETSKALAEAYFGSEKNMIRIDMSEFQEPSSVYRLIGSPPAAGSEGEKGQLTTAISDNPFSLVLLDEIEKAHPDILTLFLQVFDDGRLTDGTGKVIDFSNTIIISTSNAGSELIRESLLKGIAGEELKKQLLDFLQQKGIFRPEFLNRFDAVVAFHPLDQGQIVQVANLMLNNLIKQMHEKEITLEFTPGAVQKLAQAGFDPVYGARPMRRAIQEKVENVLAQSMLEGKIKRGSSVSIDEGDIGL